MKPQLKSLLLLFFTLCSKYQLHIFQQYCLMYVWKIMDDDVRQYQICKLLALDRRNIISKIRLNALIGVVFVMPVGEVTDGRVVRQGSQ